MTTLEDANKITIFKAVLFNTSDQSELFKLIKRRITTMFINSVSRKAQPTLETYNTIPHFEVVLGRYDKAIKRALVITGINFKAHMHYYNGFIRENIAMRAVLP